MIKASALYIVIVIALVIGILCASLVAVAYYFRAEVQQKFRYDQLRDNLSSGINILLTARDSAFQKEKTFSLFSGTNDSVTLQREAWGVYDICLAKAFVQKDTLYKTFMVANQIDSSKWAALYLLDEDRPVSVSGKTVINGDAYLPKAGIQQAYIANNAYQGDKRIVIGKKLLSKKLLPSLDTLRLRQLSVYFGAKGDRLPAKDSINASFLRPTKVFDFGHEAATVKNVTLKGNIILHSDTTLVIDSTASLENILVFARTIVVKTGFRGNCQLFALDSISVGAGAHFNYPSTLAIIRSEPPKINSQARIRLDTACTLGGQIFTYESKPGELKPLITTGKTDTISGYIYSQGTLELKDKAVIRGGVLTSKFLYKSSFTLYENYLINVTLDSRALSSYYLASPVSPIAFKKKKILQWLEGN